jgi:hypothetical protein
LRCAAALVPAQDVPDLVAGRRIGDGGPDGRGLHQGRRHLDESQRAMVAAKLATLKRGDNQHAPIGASSQNEAADKLNVGRRTATPRRQNVVTPWSKKHPDGGSATAQRTKTAMAVGLTIPPGVLSIAAK